MPTYEYRCTSCGYYFEQFQSIKDDPITECPKCGERVQKLFSSGVGLIFKGSGFYITDYKHKNSSSSNGNGTHSSNGKSGDSSKKESKPKTETTAKK